jgi:hypothetical protein
MLKMKKKRPHAKVTHWYFVVVNEAGEEQVVSYGDSSNYTQAEAIAKMNAKYAVCRVATESDVDRLAMRI